jgi:hypothetical protein
MRKLMNSLISGLLLALGLAVGGQAAATSLFTLASTGTSITVGGLRFYDWVYTLDQGSASNIDVTALSDGGLDPGPGLRFSFGTGFIVSAGESVTLSIRYQVETVDSGLHIKDNSIELVDFYLLSFTPATQLVQVLVKESVGTEKGAADVSSKDVFAEYAAGVFNSSLQKSTVFLSPHDDLWVQSTIKLTAVGTSGNAGIEELVERFSLQRVPEPGTLALLGIALAAGAMARRGGRQRPAARA